MDITPTLVELAGGKLKPGDVDGKSFVSVLDGRPDEINDYVFGAFTNCNIIDNRDRIFPIRAIRDKRHTLIWCPKHEGNITSNVTLTNGLGLIDGESKTSSSHGKGEIAVSWVRKRREDKRASFLVDRLFNRPEYALYDRSTDPHEERNLAEEAKHKEAFERMKNALHARLKELGDEDPIATETRLAKPKKLPKKPAKQ